VSPEDIKALVRTVPDFPAPGIQFRDITTLISHPAGFSATIDHLVGAARPAQPSAVAAIEARGFVFGAAIAARLGVGFVPLRKAGKLPVPSFGVDYALEYGRARLELDPTLIAADEPVLMIDDLLATGGTALAGADLLRRAGARVDRALFVIDLPELGGAVKLREAGIEPWSVIAFEGH
jgi:adenine phosphoribosyltransferase